MNASAQLTGREAALPAPVFLVATAAGVTLLFSLALNAMLDVASMGPTTGPRAATFSARGGTAEYELGSRLTFARQRPLTAGGTTESGD